MSHMMADSEAELDEFAARLGLQPAWRQGDHYDVSQSKRAQAIKLGASEVTARTLVKMRLKLREGCHAEALRRKGKSDERMDKM